MHFITRHIVFCMLLIAGIDPAAAQGIHAGFAVSSFSANSNLLPVAVFVLDENLEVMTYVSGKYVLSAQGADLQADSIHIKKGVGSVTAEVLATGDFILSVGGFSGEKQILLKDPQPLVEVEGELNGNTTWTGGQDYLITGDLIVPAGASLTIGQGTIILVTEQANITVFGSLRAEGTAGLPIVFAPAEKSHPWGGIQLFSAADTTVFEHCFFIGGGGDPDFLFGHSQSQPVVMTDTGSARFSHCYLFDNPGKAFGGVESRITIDRCVISRCDTGGEYNNCEMLISHSWYLDIPDGDGLIDDDDNDASYFTGVHPQATGASLVTHCFYVTGEDDGIDHNGANLNIENCWIEDYFHEGIAASNANALRVYNTLVKGCGQGVEAGFWQPEVLVDHCTLINNGVGLRFGDSYAWGCEGHMFVTNSILHNNADNILNYDLLTQGPISGAIDISFSMTNDPEYDTCTGCVTGTPQFDGNYLLLPGSVGSGLASDGSDMGLINPAMRVQGHFIAPDISVYPNPFSTFFSLTFNSPVPQNVQVMVYDAQGRMKYSGNFVDEAGNGSGLRIDAAGWKCGIYCLVILDKEQNKGSRKLVKLKN